METGRSKGEEQARIREAVAVSWMPVYAPVGAVRASASSRAKTTLLRSGIRVTRHPHGRAAKRRDVYAGEHARSERVGRSAFTGVNRRKRGGRC
jgi:hypothetical protein